MKSDIKIGITVGVAVVVVLMIFFIQRNQATKPTPTLTEVPDITLKPADIQPKEPTPPVTVTPTPEAVEEPKVTKTTPTPTVKITESTKEAPETMVNNTIEQVTTDTTSKEPEVIITAKPVEIPVKAEPIVKSQTPKTVEQPSQALIKQRIKPRYYKVAEGDTLSKISQAYFGSARYWTEIQNANSELIKNPNRLQVGWKIRIPTPAEISGRYNH